ncbi:single-stranded DNA-binding protein [Candidatus Dependentiae bacterium]|nr:single-stranded DNA-binding protein [Candidatus Dependentiae bacterium]
MASYNRIIMMGNLTRDPEIKQLTSGQSVCRFSIASSRQYKNRQSGNVTQEVCFIDIDVWGAQADVCKQYLNKGKPVLIEGRLKLDSWQDAEGNKRSKHTIVADRVTFLSSGAGVQDDFEQGANDDALAPFDQEMIKNNPAMSSVMDQVEKVKKAAKAKAPGATGGEVAFKDQAPFEDDLPF